MFASRETPYNLRINVAGTDASDCPYSNGFTEGVNNTRKAIKRIAYGYRNFHNFRARILITLNTCA